MADDDFSLQDILRARGQQASQNVVAAQNIPPDDAVTGLKDGPALGVPPALAAQTAEQVRQIKQQRATRAAVDGSPPVASFFASDPTKAAATQDDAEGLATVAKRIIAKGLGAPVVEPILRAQANAQNPERKEAGPFDFLKDEWDLYMGGMAPLYNIAARALGEGVARLLPGPIHERPSIGNLGQDHVYSTPEEKADYLTGQVGIAGFGMGARVPGRGLTVPRGAPNEPSFSGPSRPPADPVGGSYPTDANGFVLGADGRPASFETPQAAAVWKKAQAKEGNYFAGGPDLHPDTGEIGWRMPQEESAAAPPPGVDPVTDSVYRSTSEDNAQWLKETEQAVAETKTHARDPGLVEDFVENHVAPEATVSVDAQKIVDIWKEGEHTPFADDPQLHQEIVKAFDAGQPVEIPLSKYLAEVSGQPFADKLREGVAVNDSVTPEQAKELPESAFVHQVFADLWNNHGPQTDKLINALIDGGLGAHNKASTPAEIEKLLQSPHTLAPHQEKMLRDLESLGVIKAAPEGEGSPSEAIAKEAPPEIDEDTLQALQDQGLSPSDFMNFVKGNNTPEPQAPLGELFGPEKAQFDAARKAVKKAAELARKSFMGQLFKDPKALDMTPKQYAGYAYRVHQAYNDLVQKLWNQQVEKIKKQYTSEWRAAYHENFGPTLDELMAEPAMQAAHELRYSKGEEDQLAKETKLKDEKGKPLVFYHGSQYWNIGTPENPWRPTGQPVISFSYDTKFANNWVSGNEPLNEPGYYDDYDPKDTKGKHRKTIYVVNLNAKSVADFRKPEHVQKAANWFAERDWKEFQGMTEGTQKYQLADLGLEPRVTPETKALFLERNAKQHVRALSEGSWSKWEDPEMMRALGWDAGHMKESPLSQSLNIFVLDGEQVYFRYRQMEQGLTLRLHPDLKTQFPEALWKQLPKSMFSKEHGVPAADLAARFGFDSPETMLRELSQLEVQRGDTPFRQFVKQTAEELTRQRTVDQVGDLLSPDKIQADAKALFTSPQAVDLLTANMQHLAKKADLPFSKEDVETKALQDFASTLLKRAVNLTTYERAIKRWGDKAEEALVKGKPDFLSAFQAKQRQIVNVHQLNAAHEVTALLKKWGPEFKRFASNRKIAGMAQPYLDAIHGELQRHGMSVPQANLEYNYEKFFGEEVAKGNFGLAIPDSIPDKPIRELTVEQFQALTDRIATLANAGRAAEKITVAGQKADMEILRREAVAGAPPTKPKVYGTEVDTSIPAQVFLGTRKPEMVYRELDSRNPTGVFTRVLHWGARDADVRRQDIRQNFSDPIKKALSKIPNSVRARWAEPVPAGHNLIDPRTGHEYKLSKLDLIGVALNMGSEQNRWHLEQGGLDWNPEDYEGAIERYLQPHDLEFAQTLLDEVAKLWPDIADTMVKMTGLAPDKVKPTEFEFHGQKYKGGYWPLMRDSWRNPPGKWEEVTVDSFTRGMMEARTANGFTKRRTWARYVPSLDWNQVLFDHMNKVSTFIAYGEWVQDANRFIQDATIDKIVKDVLGPDGPKYLRDIIKQQVGFRNVETKVVQAASSFLRGLREHTYMTQAGMNFKVMLEHTVAIPQTIAAIGERATAEGYMRLLFDWGRPEFGDGALVKFPNGTISRVHSLSPFMRQRMTHINVIMGELIEDIKSDTSLKPHNAISTITHAVLQKVRELAHWSLSAINHYLVAVPAWEGEYHKALREGAEPAEAIRRGDSAVSRSHGSGAAPDLAPIQSSNAMFKTFTYYMQYHVNLLNQAVEAGQLIVGGKDWKERLEGIRQGFWLLVATAIITDFVTDNLPTKKEMKDAAGMAAWAGEGLLSNLSGGMFMLRDIEKMVTQEKPSEWRYKGLEQLPPLKEIANLTATAGEDLGSAAHILGLAPGAKVPHNWLMNNLDAIGFLFKLPGGQVGRTAQAASDMKHPNPRTGAVQQPVRALLFGPSHERAKR